MPIEIEEEWKALIQEVGETLLDAQRTFMDLVDQRYLELPAKPELASYQAALAKLQVANGQLLRYLLLEEEAAHSHLNQGREVE